MNETSAFQDLVAIGTIARPQGRRGEVIVNPLTDFPDRFTTLERVFVSSEDGGAVALRVEGAREQGGRPVLKIEGVETIGQAEALAGKEVRIPESELRALGPGMFYVFKLRGFSVWDRNAGELGVVEDVVRTGGTDLIVVRSLEGHELLIPFCEDICRTVDGDAGRIEIVAPEGLLTLNAN